MSDDPPRKAFTALIQRHLDERGWTFDDLARAMAPKQWLTSKRKIERLLGGGRDNRMLVEAISRTLGLNPGERSAAFRSDRMDWCRHHAELQQSRFSPHFWIEASSSWRSPSLMTSGLRRTVKVPEGLLELDDEATIIREAGAFVAADVESPRCGVEREHVNHYVYRPKAELGYRFTPKGEFVERVEGLYLGEVSRNPAG